MPVKPCNNPTCIAENVNAEGWCPVHEKHHALEHTPRALRPEGYRQCVHCYRMLGVNDGEHTCVFCRDVFREEA